MATGPTGTGITMFLPE